MAVILFNFGPKTLLPQRFEEHRTISEIYPELETYTPLFASNYQFASLLSFHLHRIVYKVAGSGRVDFFDFLFSADQTPSKIYFFAQVDQSLPERFSSFKKTLLKKFDSHLALFEVTP